VAGDPDHGGPPKRSALDQLPLKQRVLAEQRGFIVSEHAAPGDVDDWIPPDDHRTARIVGVIVVLVIAVGLVVGLVALGAALR
jgi:hypothetical protein